LYYNIRVDRKARKRGRPKLPPNEAKGKIVPIRLDAGDLHLVSTAAKTNKVRLSEWMRKMLREGAEAQMFERTLHEAMVIVLSEKPGQTATSAELSDIIQARRLYTRKDSKPAKPQQVIARARKYPHLFEVVAPGVIRLHAGSPQPPLEMSQPQHKTVPDFAPVDIAGEPLSQTILRERR
jgi:hypothetical protein